MLTNSIHIDFTSIDSVKVENYSGCIFISLSNGDNEAIQIVISKHLNKLEIHQF